MASEGNGVEEETLVVEVGRALKRLNAISKRVGSGVNGVRVVVKNCRFWDSSWRSGRDV